MYPVYGCMDSYPQPYSHQRNCVPYPLYCYPGWDALTQQMKIDPSNSAVNDKPCPNTSCFGYSNPSECHGCCHHSYPPGFYSFGHPHSPSPLPPAVYYHGPYPSYPEAFPAYFTPPHYPLEQAACKYAKNMGREHCCGCPSHSFNEKVDSNVQIEEEKPEVEQKDKDNGFTGMMKRQNHPYPVIWLPPSYLKNKESSKQSEPPDPKSWNGWVPFDVNGVKPFMWGGEEKRNKDQQGEDKMHFPFPIIWMPDHDNPKEIEKKDVKEINASQNDPEEPPKFRIIPVKLLENGYCGEKPGVAQEVDGGADSSLASRKGTTKADTIIPNQMEESKDKDSETTSRSIPVKQVAENREKKPSEESRAKQPSENNAKKASKLPPVCLRVDPPPKKKNGNGTLRSPSPPSLKDRVQQDSKSEEPVQHKVGGGESKKKDQSLANKAEQPSRTKEVVQDVASKGESKKKDIKVIKVQEKENQEAGELSKEKDMKAIEIDGNKTVLSNEVKQEVPAEKETGVEVEKKIVTESKKGGPDNAGQVQVQLGAHANSGVVSERSNIKTVESKGRKKELSITDAAVLIQAAYRGYEVRKWEPMKKMKQIAKVRDQIADIKGRIKELGASGDLQQYEKQRLIIGETIMNLLLQPDTIQGLHPSVREVRKSVAKELVCLQEKLDSLPVQKTGRHMTTLPESVPLQKVLEDYPKAFEDASLSTVTQAETAAALNLTMTGKATGEEEVVKQTGTGKIQLRENEHAETESSLVEEDEGLKTRHELSVDPSPPSENKISSSEREQLLEDPTLGNGSLDAATVLVESLPSTDQEQSPVPLESIALEGETKIDSEAEGSMGLMRDEACVSAVEKQMGVPSNQKDEEPPSELVLAEEPQKGEELALGAKFAEAQSVDDFKVEPHFELPEGSKEMNPLRECEQTSSAKDRKGDCVTVAPVESSAREGEPELGIRELLVVAETAEKDKEQKCRTDGEMGTPSAESLAEATGNDASELPPEMNVKAGSSLDDLPILSEITVGFNSAADKHAQYPEVGSFGAVAPVKDGDKLVYEGSKMVELESPVVETENATVAENVLDKSLETEVAENEAAEAENKPASAAMTVIGGTDQPPDGLKFSKGIATEVESPVSKPSTAPVATPLLSPGSEILKALENQDGSLSLEAAGVPIVDAGTHCLEVTDAVSEVPSAKMWKGSAASDDVELRKEDEKAMDRTEDLKEMLEKLVEAGKQQLTVISDLNERVRDLEKKLAQKKKLKGKKRSVAVRPWCMKNVDARLEGMAAATIV